MDVGEYLETKLAAIRTPESRSPELDQIARRLEVRGQQLPSTKKRYRFPWLLHGVRRIC